MNVDWPAVEAVAGVATAFLTILLAAIAGKGLQQLRLTKKDMLTRAQRDSISAAIERSKEFADVLLKQNGDVLDDFAAHKVPVFVKSPSEVKFDPDNSAELPRARAWCKALPPGLFGRSINVLNRLEAWSMEFTHRIADSSVAYGPCAPTYCQAVVQLYAVLLVMRNNENSGKYPNVVALYESWMSVKQVERQQLRLEAILAELDTVQREGSKVKGLHSRPIGTEELD